MKSILMTTSAVLLVTGFAAGQAQAACPEDIDSFNRQYEQTLLNTPAGEALSTAEQAQLFGLRTAAENLYQAGNAEMCAAVIERANLILDSAIAPQVIKPDELIGREVVNAQDENLGEIEEIMLDPMSGRIAYVVVEHGGFLGIGDNLFAVPWGAMQFVPGNDQTLLLNIPEEKLENAPRFSREDETPLERREWVTSVHNYYGVEPYWQDDVGAMAVQYGSGGAAATGGQEAGAAAGGAQTGQSGEVKTIVVPITTPESDGGTQNEQGQPQTGGTQSEAGQAQPETEQAQSAAEQEQLAAAQPQGEQEQPAADAQQQPTADSPAEPATGAAALVETQPAAGEQGAGAEQAAEEIGALASRMDELEQQVRTLSEQMPGQDMTEAMSRLEEQVQQLSQQMPGDELQQQIAQLQEQVAALGDGGAPAGGADQGQPAAVIVAPTQDTQTGQQEPAQEPPAQSQAAQEQPAAPPATQPRAGQQESGQAGTGQQQAGQQQPGQAETAPQQDEQQQNQEAALQGRTVVGTPVPETEGDAAGGQPCEEMIAKLEEDLQRAEELGIVVDDAESEFREAQAMLNNNSEALCRAAIKRAHAELVAVGFEPN